jgi:hypothetical protein
MGQGPEAGLFSTFRHMGAPGRAVLGHMDTGQAAASTGRPSAFPEDDQGQGAATSRARGPQSIGTLHELQYTFGAPEAAASSG